MKRVTFVALSLVALLGWLAAVVVAKDQPQAATPRQSNLPAPMTSDRGMSQQVATAGVTIPEGAETLVVDGSSTTASDNNPGTSGQPLRTVNRAAALAAANNLRGVATRIVIRPGVYRESVTLGKWRDQTSAPISFEGPTTGTATLTGSDVWAGWRQVAGSGTLYRHAWPHRWGLAALPTGWGEAQIPEIVRRREMVFANGRLLRQVLSQAQLARTSGGAFYVDEANRQITIKLHPGQRSSRTKVEVATREQVLRVDGRRNVRISNLTFKHAASRLQQPAVRVESSTDVEITNARFVQNNWTGLALNNDHDITVRRSNFDRNGSMGFSALHVKDLRLERTSNSYNTWRGNWGAWYGWENGMKLIGVHGAVLQDHTATGNHSHGLWLDTDNREITVRRSRICGNRLAGAFLEATQGPIVLDHVILCRNGERGILAGNARNVTVANSQLVDNGHAQIVLSGVQSGRRVTDWESQQSITVVSTGWTVKDNRIQAASGQLLVDNTWSAATWSNARPTYRWNSNDFAGATERSFRLLGTYRLGTLAEWRAHTGLDSTSTHRRPLR